MLLRDGRGTSLCSLLLVGCYAAHAPPGLSSHDAGPTSPLEDSGPPPAREDAAPPPPPPPPTSCDEPTGALSDPERTWSEVERIQGAFEFGASWPHVSVGTAGAVVATWYGSDGMAQGVIASRFRGGARWEEPMHLGPVPLSSSQPAIASRGGVSTVVWHSGGTVWAARSSGGAWDGPEPLGDADSFPDPAVAVDRTGRSFAVWVGGGLVYGSVTDGSGWSAPQPLGGSADYSGAPALAVDPCGNAIAVFAPAGGPVMASHFIDGRWRSASPIPESGALAGEGSGPSLAISPTGRAIAVWVEAEGGGVRYSAYEPGVGWSRSRSVATSTGYPFAAHASLNAGGEALLVWGELGRGIGSEVWAARVSRDGTVMPERLTSDSGAHPMVPSLALAGNAAGEAVAVWSREADGHFEARTYRPGRGWGPLASFAGEDHSGSLVDASMGPDGHAAIAWVESDPSGVHVVAARLR